MDNKCKFQYFEQTVEGKDARLPMCRITRGECQFVKEGSHVCCSI